MMKGIPLLTSKQIKSVIVLCQVAVSSLAKGQQCSEKCNMHSYAVRSAITIDPRQVFFPRKFKVVATMVEPKSMDSKGSN
jgi:hypothetical protein